VARPQRILEEQKELIRMVLRSVVVDDMVSGTDRDRALVLPGRVESLGIQRRPKTSADYTAAVHHLVDSAHPHVRWQLRAALEQLPLRDRHILFLRVSWDHSQYTVRHVLRLPGSFKVNQHVEALLGELATKLWNDEGLAVIITARPRALEAEEA